MRGSCLQWGHGQTKEETEGREGTGPARRGGGRGRKHCRLSRGHTAHGGGDLSVFAQQAHVGLNKGEIFFLCVGRVSGGRGQLERHQGSLLSVPPPVRLNLHPPLTSTLRTEGSGASSGQSGSSW